MVGNTGYSQSEQITKKESTATVSYTHLDVYKRQIAELSNTGISIGASIFSAVKKCILFSKGTEINFGSGTFAKICSSAV